MNKLLYILIFCMMGFGMPKSVIAQKGSKISTVVIDAGHGGKDPGAVGKNSREKHVALSIALKTGEYISKYLPDVKVIYTRKDDRFIPLHERAEIANKNNADFFISIHCNSNNNTKAYGSETYTMGLHKNNANLDVAILENAAILFEDDADEQYGGFDANSVESYIQFNLYQDEYQDQSNLLATNIQDQFKNRVGRKDRGVHQAGFLVLWRTAMPGVLVELGFISNLTEEKFLLSEEGQSFMASAIYRAFKQYKQDYELENKIVVTQEEPENIPKREPEVETESVITVRGLNYRVQFFTSPNMILLSDPRFSKLLKMAFYEHNGLYKYTSGMFANTGEASKLLVRIRELGYKDAFIAAFNNNERITMEEARRLESIR